MCASFRTVEILKCFIIAVLVTVISISFSQSLHAQGGEPKLLKIAAQSNGNSVSLRWVPGDDKIWEEANAVGYKLIRYTLVSQGVPVPPESFQSTKLVLEESMMPLTESQWASQFSNNDAANLASAAVWGLDTTNVVSASPTLADAVNNREAMGTRFFLSLLSAERDYDVAQGLALAYVDNNVSPGDSLMYLVKLNSSLVEYENTNASIVVDVNTMPNLPSPTDLSTEGLDLSAMINWDIESIQEYYSTYDIERSTDNRTFVKVNNTPFLFASGEGNESSIATYKDEIPDNTTTFYYRVIGNTPFGTSGPPSQSVTVTGKPPRLNFNFTLDSAWQFDGNRVTVNWTVTDPSLLSSINGFNVYRSTKSNKDFVKLNAGLGASDRDFYPDRNPIKRAYYQIEAVDNNNYSYLSNIVFYQEPDSIPPAVPVGLSGGFLTSSLVQLEWTPNTEVDLKGYRVFVANKHESIYTQVTSKPVEEASYTFEIDETFLVDSIYFKVIATDQNDNYSERSICLPLERPDVVPPSKPVLHKANPTPAGIEVGFKFSSSPDVDYHTLERKKVSSGAWENVLNIPKNEESNYSTNLTPNSVTTTCYLDTTILDRAEYQFRFNAYDLNANVSTSKAVFVRPYDNGFRGNIEDFVINVNCFPTDSVTNQGGYDLLDTILTNYFITDEIDLALAAGLVAWNVITGAEYNTLQTMTDLEAYEFLDARKIATWGEQLIAISQLNWVYDVADLIKDFQIYRSAESSALMLYKTIPLDELEDYVYKDIDVKPGGRYFYQIIARHIDGGHSDPSKLLMVKVPNSL